MAFSDPDPLEQDMGRMCQDMTADQLVAYIIAYHDAFGLRLVIDGMKERSVFTAMQRAYGRRDAGLIVKWVFYRHKGRCRDEPVTPFTFAKGHSWWVQKMHCELQMHLQKEADEKAKAAAPTVIGARSLADL